MRKVLSYALLVGAVAWLVLSYLPVEIIALDHVFQGQWVARAFHYALLASVVVFVAIQTVLVGASMRVGRLAEEHQIHPQIRINVALEVFWTAVPLAITVSLLVIGYRLLG